jgi:hypothetical protein
VEKATGVGRTIELDEKVSSTGAVNTSGDVPGGIEA